MTTHLLHKNKTLKGKKSQVTFNPTTTTIPQPKMSYYPQQQHHHQYQSPQTHAYGQMPTYQPQATCTFGVYPPRVRDGTEPHSRVWLRLLQCPLGVWKSVRGLHCSDVRIMNAFFLKD